MAKDWQKFLRGQDKRSRVIITTITEDILNNDISQYDCIPMEGIANHRRIKHNNIRIIFSKSENNEIMINKIGFRGDVYK